MKIKSIILSMLLFLTPLNAHSQTEEFKLKAQQPGLIEQTLLNQAIENDPQIKILDKELNKGGFVRDVGNIGASSIKSSIRILNLSHYAADGSSRFVTNGLNLSSDLLNVATVAYKLHKTKKTKKELEGRINFIKSTLLEVFSRLNISKDDIEAKNKLISFVGEKSANDYLNWLEINSK